MHHLDFFFSFQMENVLFSFLPCMLLLRSPYISGVAKPLHAEKLLWTYTNKSQDTTALLFVPREALNKSREAKQRSRGLQVIAARSHWYCHSDKQLKITPKLHWFHPKHSLLQKQHWGHNVTERHTALRIREDPASIHSQAGLFEVERAENKNGWLLFRRVTALLK